MVGVEAAVAAGPGIPGKLPVAPLNFHCPYEVMMGNKKNKQPKKRKNNWIAQIRSVTKMKASWKKNLLSTAFALFSVVSKTDD